MPFDWMEPKRNPAHVKTLQAKREAMYRSELADRAALLHRLGHSRARVKARLAANIGWDFEAAGSNPFGAAAAAATPGSDANPAARFDAILDPILDREFGAATNGARPKDTAK
jgi:hypothetical protein